MGFPQRRDDITAADVERDLVAYLHGEATDLPAAEIRRWIDQDPTVAAAYASLRRLTRTVTALPGTQPSREFVRSVVRKLARMRADGLVSRRLEDFVRRTRWSLEDHLLFATEYARYKLVRRPVSAAALLLILIGAVAVPVVASRLGVGIDRAPVVSATPEASGFAPENYAALAPDGAVPIVEPDEIDGFDLPTDMTPPELEGELDEPGGSALVDRNGPRATPPAPDPGSPRIPPLPRDDVRPQPRGVSWAAHPGPRRLLAQRIVTDRERGVSRQDRRLIDSGLIFLASVQGADGAWRALPKPKPGDLVEGDDAPPDGDNPASLRPDSVTGKRTVEPVVIEGTARALLAFLAENHSSRPPDRAPLAPARQRYSPIPAHAYDAVAADFSAAVKAGVNFLLDRADADGRLCAPGENETIAHALALTALCEDFVVGANYRVRERISAAYLHLRRIRNDDGGWGSAPGERSNVVATTHAMTAIALYAATPGAGATLSSTALKRLAGQAAQFLGSCTADNGTTYLDASWSSAPPRAAAAVLFAERLLTAMERPDDLGKTRAARLALIAETERLQPRWIWSRTERTIDFDFWWLTESALAAWPVDDAAAEPAGDWRDGLRDMLAAHGEERPGVVAVGDNPPVDAVAWPGEGFAPSGFDAWATATVVLTLQSPYRYAWRSLAND
jgi:hypothetical protein